MDYQENLDKLNAIKSNIQIEWYVFTRRWEEEPQNFIEREEYKIATFNDGGIAHTFMMELYKRPCNIKIEIRET